MQDREPGSSTTCVGEEPAPGVSRYTHTSRLPGLRGHEIVHPQEDGASVSGDAFGSAGIARMGRETFTVRMLRQAAGRSYRQTRRVLQGFQFDAGRCREWAAELAVRPEEEGGGGLPVPFG